MEEEMEPPPQMRPAPPSSAAPPAEERESPPLTPILGCPFADRLPLDVEAIQHSADAFFEQIAKISEEWQDGRVFQELTPWIAAACMAAYQWVRLRKKQSCLLPQAEECGGPDPRMISDC
jgi:hypothetical protein